MSTFPADEEFIASSHAVISDDHFINIRYHLFQDNHEEPLLHINDHCYIVMDDLRHEPHLIAAVIESVEHKNRKYKVRRINDNLLETYEHHQIVQRYDRELHSIDINKHKEKIEKARNAKKQQQDIPLSNIQKTPKKRKRSNDLNDTPNKKRKLNDQNTENIQNTNEQTRRLNNCILTVAQPCFPKPHPYFRQNALLKWKGQSYNNETKEWDVGRIVDFDVESDIIYIQATYGCGTADDEQSDLMQVKWSEFEQKYSARFIKHRHLFRLHQQILYWWDRKGTGQICEDVVEQLDYGAENLYYGISGYEKETQRSKVTQETLKWCKKGEIYEYNDDNYLKLSEYIAKGTNRQKRKRGKAMEPLYYDCIVVGGGMAGLTVQWALKAANKDYKVKILEAQSRLGGRLRPHTFREKQVCDPETMKIYKIPQVKVELGAAFLSGSGRDNRFWQWLKKNDRHICADWGGYNNGWWQRGSFIDTKTGKFAHEDIIEGVKDRCDDISVLICKLLFPLEDIPIIEALEYLKHRIPEDQLFHDHKLNGQQMELLKSYFFEIFDKYKILSANWVGPQGLWQHQQTKEFRTLDFETLYVFLKNINCGNKWLLAVEKLISECYGTRINVKTLNSADDDDDDDDSEATVSLSPGPMPQGEYELGDDVIVFDVSAYDRPFFYKFGFKEVLLRDLLYPPGGEEEEERYKQSMQLSEECYARFKDALIHMAPLSLFSLHLFNLKCDKKYNKLPKAKKLLRQFDDDLVDFEESVDEFKKILNDGATQSSANETIVTQKPKPQSFQNRKIMNGNHINGTNVIAPSLPTQQQPLLKLNGGNIVVNPVFNPSAMPQMFSNLNVNNNNHGPLPLATTTNNNSLLQSMIPQNTEKSSPKASSKKKRKKSTPKKKKNEWNKLEKQIDKDFKQEKFNPQLYLDPSAYLLGDGFVTKGYSQVLQPFRGNDNDISLYHQVTSIERVRMDYKYGTVCEIRGINRKTAKPFLYYSKFCAVTVPLGILKMSLKKEGKTGGGITFKPLLSVAKQEAINAMGMGCENKVYLRFTHNFWGRDKPYFQSIQHPEYRFINFSYREFKLGENSNILCTMIPPTMGKKWYLENPAQQLRVIWDVCRVIFEMFKEHKEIIHNVRVIKNPSFKRYDHYNNNMNGSNQNGANKNENNGHLHLNGSNGHMMEQDDEKKTMEDEKMSDDVNKQRTAKLDADGGVGQVLKMLVDYKVTDWEHNVFSRGSYSYLPKGAIYSHCKNLQEYDGNGVYFCGEATSVDGFECVDGAHETGFNVAKNIHTELQKLRGNR